MALFESYERRIDQIQPVMDKYGIKDFDDARKICTDLVCDAINTAMRELFLQIVYGRSQSAFSEGGLPIGAGLEDLGKGTRSQIGTIYSTKTKGPRYLELAEGYIVEIGLDKDDQIIGYKYVNLGKMMENIKKGIDAMEAIEQASGTYGRFDEAVKKIDPREE